MDGLNFNNNNNNKKTDPETITGNYFINPIFTFNIVVFIGKVKKEKTKQKKLKSQINK